MARTIVAQRKGGAGKIALLARGAAAFAEEGVRHAIVDGDPQGSRVGWMRLCQLQLRSMAEIGSALVAGWRLPSRRDRLARDFHLSRVDTPAHAETKARVAVRAPKSLLLPREPSMLDVSATGTSETARGEQRLMDFVFSRVPPRAWAVEGVRALAAQVAALWQPAAGGR